MTSVSQHNRARNGLSSRSRAILWGAAAALLSVPLIGMLLTSQVNWGPGDFVVMGGLLAALCAAVELAFALTLTRGANLAVIGTSLFVFLAIWAELAVGIFD